MLTLLILAASAVAGAKQSRVVVVLAGSCTIRDFADSDHKTLQDFIQNASTGLLNVRTGRASRDSMPASKSGFEAGCAVLGAGAMATGGGEIRLAGDVNSHIGDQTAGSIYTYRTGINPSPANVLHTEIARMQRINDAASYRAKPGSLGSSLRSNGIKTAVIGNSDMPGEMHRECVAAAMDEQGIVDFGEVDGDKLNLSDPAAPFGVRVNADALLEEFDNLPEQCRFVVIDFGDTFRADLYAEYCTDPIAARHRRAAISRLGDFMSNLAARLNPKTDLLIALSPNPRTLSDIAGEKLGVIAISGPGFERGMLTSGSTRRAGVVTLSDVAPTILSFLNISVPSEMVGRPILNIESENVASQLIEMNRRASAQSERQAIMRGTSVAQSVMVALIVLAVFATTLPALKLAAAWLTTGFVALPLAMFIMPLFFDGGASASIVVLIALTIALAAAGALILKTPARAFIWLCAIFFGAVIVDLSSGGSLMQSSIASYNIVEGARFYGIGNELMGTMLGASVIGVGMALSSRKLNRRVSGLIAGSVFCLTLVFVAAPGLGANVGGALAMASAMGAALLVGRGSLPSLRHLAVIAVVLLLIVAAVFSVDLLNIGHAQTHIGRTMRMAAGGNIAAILDIFKRKIALNCMLISASLWSRLLGLSLVGSAVLYWNEKRVRGAGFLNREQSAAAFGCFVGTLAAFIFNDSGVVAGATSSVFLFALIALKLLQRPTPDSLDSSSQTASERK